MRVLLDDEHFPPTTDENGEKVETSFMICRSEKLRDEKQMMFSFLLMEFDLPFIFSLLFFLSSPLFSLSSVRVQYRL